jgi:hypothetical protein
LKKLLNRLFWTVVTLVVAGYGVILWWFNAHENDLIYAPDREIRVAPEIPGVAWARVTLVSADGVHLVGRLYRGMIPDSAARWVLYFHGNAGNATGRSAFHARLVQLGVNVLVAEYRGYGESEGAPDEAGISRDANAFYGYARDTLRVPPERLVLYGHSLGSGVAVELAMQKPVAGLIVEGAMTSIPDRGQELYPYLPIGLMANNRFASVEKIGRIMVPKLFLHAVDDEVIPIAHGRRLYDGASHPKMFQEVRGGHDGSYQRDAHIFFGAIETFLERVKSGTAF